MAEAEPLFQLLELMLRTFSMPAVKPGGHAEEMFIGLTEEEKEDLECSICYQILKDVRQCENKHTFCYGCIYVWSTSGNPINHGKCPVCRVDGMYTKNYEIDEKINSKLVKCQMKTCRWIGSLRHLASHQHTTYSSPSESSSAKSTDFPMLNIGSHVGQVANPARATHSVGVSAGQVANQARTTQNAGVNVNQIANTARTTQNVDSHVGQTENTTRSSQSVTSRASASTQRSTTSSQRQPLTNVTNTNTNASPTTNNQRTNVSTTGNRSRSRSRPRQNSSSPQRRPPNTTATGFKNGRLTSRARLQNNNTVSITASSGNNANDNTEQIVQTPRSSDGSLIPHPPTTPRPNRQGARRVPTLPTISNGNTNSNNNTTNNNNYSHTEGQTTPGTSVTDSNNNANPLPASSSLVTSEQPPRFTVESAVLRRQRMGQNRGFSTIRDRLNESRQRLDLLMNAFSSELDRGRTDLNAFQQERERRRQEQLAEVRDLGRRLGHVAQELRGLLSQRRDIHSQIDHLAESITDDSD